MINARLIHIMKIFFTRVFRIVLLTVLGVVALAGAAEQGPQDKVDAAVRLNSDLDQMVELKIISSPIYWQEHALKGNSCAGERVAELLIAIAKSYGPVRDLEESLDVLMKNGVIINDYWAKNALEGKKCHGEFVANVIHAGAKELRGQVLLARYGVPAGIISCPEPSAFSPLVPSGKVSSFNTIIGTQTIGPSYQFTDKTKLIETAEAIMDMGPAVIKFALSKQFAKPNGNIAVDNPNITSLVELVRDEPSHRKVMDMPFAYYVLWVHTFSSGGWNRGYKHESLEKEYREIYDFTCYLLKAYNGSGKTFYLGHWEGDGWLRGSVATENDVKVTPEAVRSMVEWLNTRQRAVDDAKRDVQYKGVQVWHYTEVNHVWLAMEGRPALVNKVLPETDVDLVSYSSYDTERDPEKLKAALNYIESQLKPKPAITGRRVFIGEYGFPGSRNSPEEQDALSRQVMRSALEWGCPFILYWEMYNNEVEDGKQIGFWLIDDKGAKQPIYNTHRRFCQWSKKYISDTVAQTGRMPSNNMFRKSAVTFLSR